MIILCFGYSDYFRMKDKELILEKLMEKEKINFINNE
jgi:hypothetical protein